MPPPPSLLWVCAWKTQSSPLQLVFVWVLPSAWNTFANIVDRMLMSVEHMACLFGEVKVESLTIRPSTTSLSIPWQPSTSLLPRTKRSLSWRWQKTGWNYTHPMEEWPGSCLGRDLSRHLCPFEHPTILFIC